MPLASGLCGKRSVLCVVVVLMLGCFRGVVFLGAGCDGVCGDSTCSKYVRTCSSAGVGGRGGYEWWGPVGG